jgi:hypothetical protein
MLQLQNITHNTTKKYGNLHGSPIMKWFEIGNFEANPFEIRQKS